MRKLTTEEFIIKAIKIHNGFYTYGNSRYITARERLTITCPIHGDFLCSPGNHLRGRGCPKCGYTKSGNLQRKTTKGFIIEANKIHHNKYDYSKTVYTGYKNDVIIICPTHGEFLQTPDKHINRKHGCPICRQSHLESDVSSFLDEWGIEFIRQYRFDDSKLLPFDFYLPQYNIIIECQGKQHFIEGCTFGSKHKNSSLKEITTRDLRKQDICKSKNVHILYYTNVKLKVYPYPVILTKDDLLESIKKVGAF